MKDNFSTDGNPLLHEMCDLIMLALAKDIGFMGLLMFQKINEAEDEHDKMQTGFSSLSKAALCGAAWMIDCQRNDPETYEKILNLYKKGIDLVKSKRI